MANVDIGNQIEILILGAQRVSVDDVNGVKISYIYGTDFSPVTVSSNEYGMNAGDAWIPDLSVWNNIVCAPAMYIGEFRLKMQKGKPQLQLVNVMYVGEFRCIDKKVYDTLAEEDQVM